MADKLPRPKPQIIFEEFITAISDTRITKHLPPNTVYSHYSTFRQIKDTLYIVFIKIGRSTKLLYNLEE